MSNTFDTTDPAGPAQHGAPDPSLTDFTDSMAHEAGVTRGTAAHGHREDTFQRDLLDALVRFRDGDFEVRIASDFTGIDGKVADVFNGILAVSARRAEEIARVCRVVGKEESSSSA